MKSVTVVSEDRVGLLADISYILGKSNLNIEGLVVDVIGGRAVISMEVKDTRKAKNVLECNGFKAIHPDAIIIKVPTQTVEKVSEMLAAEKVSVTEMKALSSDSNDGIYAVQVDKPRKASRMLSPFLLGNIPEE